MCRDNFLIQKLYYSLFTVAVPRTGSGSKYISNTVPIQAQILKQTTKPRVFSSWTSTKSSQGACKR